MTTPAQPQSGQPQYAQPQYAQPGWGPPPPPYDQAAYGPPVHGPHPGYVLADYRGASKPTESKAVVALVLAMASFTVIPLLPAIAALVVAPSARRSITASQGRLGGDGLLTAARVVSWSNIALVLLAVVVVVVLLMAADGPGVFGDREVDTDLEPYPA